MNIIEKWKDPFASIPDVIKWSLELMILIAFIFLLVVYIYSYKKNPLFRGKGHTELLVAIVIGLIGATIEFIDNWIWFTTFFYEGVWKPLKITLVVFSILLFVLAFRKIYKLSDAIFAPIFEERGHS